MRTLSASDAKRALELVRTHRVHVVLTDLMMPGTTGLELLRAIKQVAPDVEVVLMTAFGSVEAAVSAMRDGAYDFVEKPLKRLSIVKSVRKAAERQRLVAENRSLKDEIKRLAHREIVGSSPALRRVVDVATQAAPSQATVLVLGESGTGKELVARYIHERSARARGPFVAVNCAAIPETILESELFGHERGAFTGAVAQEGGPLREGGRAARCFLDEIGELSPSVQVKLLRVLQEGEYEPLGGNTTQVRRAHRRRDQPRSRRRGRGGPVPRGPLLPPQRHRDHRAAAARAARGHPAARRSLPRPLLREERPRRGCTRRAARSSGCMDYAWPGNVRELENVIERAVVLSRNETLERERPARPHRARRCRARRRRSRSRSARTLDEIELRVIRETLRHTKGDKSLAAQLLGISTRTIYRKLDGVTE